MFWVEDGVLKGFDRTASCEGDVMALPNGITSVGAKAMQKFRCEKLVMPSTLRHIEKEAFKDASISEIDFGDCQLETIESEAFWPCEAKAALPDSVRKIGALGAYSLAVSEGSTMRLPKSLRYIANTGVCLANMDDVEVDESSVTAETNLAISIISSLRPESWVTVHVLREGKEEYSFVLCNDRAVSYRWSCMQNFIGSKGVDFKVYDEGLDKIAKVCCKVKAYALRLAWPIELPRDKELMYRTYVLKHYNELMQGKAEDLEAIKIYGEADLISRYHLEELLENARRKQNIALVAYLMDLLKRKHGSCVKILGL
ncbi:MAG: leucine-rich repeat domain-containing protein [Clostridiales bacterium]|jgi:hypothetical protein|nr:leucine-rich repeat domain-containing protein [Clostridiales bacterium]MDR2752250.1 leucine-rich repeat domain-containing protein [Clostridiales bacterium]